MKKCKNCGGALVFDPNTSNLKCVKCNEQVEFSKPANYTWHNFDMMTSTPEAEYTPTEQKLHCSNCGAVFTGKNYSISDTCEYCGTNLVMEKEDNTTIDAVIPFSFDKESAKSKFKLGLKKKWFLPNKFKKEPPSNTIESVYIPAYLANTKTSSLYNGELYHKNTSSDGTTKYSYFKISGVYKDVANNLLAECSGELNQATIDQIKPFDVSKAKKYKPEYLQGYSVEYYDKKLDACKEVFKKQATIDIRRQILRKYNYDGVRFLRINTSYSDSAYCKIILPTYRVKYTYNKKSYTTFMNGDNGKVGGNLPRSAFKITAFVLGITAIVGILGYFVIKYLI